VNTILIGNFFASSASLSLPGKSLLPAVSYGVAYAILWAQIREIFTLPLGEF
jgi:hypothetical protein